MKNYLKIIMAHAVLLASVDVSGVLRGFDAPGEESIGGVDVSKLNVRIGLEMVGVTGVMPIRYELNGTTISLATPKMNAGVNRLHIELTYGTNTTSVFDVDLVVPQGADGQETHALNMMSVETLGGTGGDYKTDVYMDGVGRVIVERMEDGSTVLLDEHENPILKRNADGSTVYFDAYQSERMRINAHGDVEFNANVTGAGMHRVELVYDSTTNTIQLDGVVQNYSQVEALIADAGNFVTLQDGDDTSFLLPHYGDGAAIIFTGLDVFSDGDYSHRIAINFENDVKREYFAIQRRKEAKVIANDVAEIMLNEDEVVIAEARTADLNVTMPYMAPKGAEFHLFIAVAGTPTITWPTGITWAGDAPTIESGKTVEVSFVNNFATFVVYENV